MGSADQVSDMSSFRLRAVLATPGLLSTFEIVPIAIPARRATSSMRGPLGRKLPSAYDEADPTTVPCGQAIPWTTKLLKRFNL